MGVVIAAVFVILLVIAIKKKWRFVYYALKIPGPTVLPLFGNLELLARMRPENIYSIVTELRYVYNQSFRLWLGPNLWVFLHSPDEIKQVLNDGSLGKAENFHLLNVLLGNGLLISEGGKWRAHRKALTPAFHPTVIDGFTDTISFHADRFVEILRKKRAVEMTNYLFLCVLDTICETSMGAEINSQIDHDNKYAHAFHDTAHLLFQRMVNPLYFFDLIYKRTKAHGKLTKAIAIIHELTERLIVERSKFHTEMVAGTAVDEFGRKRKQALLDILLSSKINERNLTHDEIKDEVNTFLFAGVDTTTASMCFILYALAKHQEMQQKAYEEIESFFGTSPNAALTISAINKMEYLDIFIKECLRLYTTVPLTGRQAKERTTIGDMKLEKGTVIWVNMFALAHDPQYFPEPDVFRPERFEPANRGQIDPFAYIPFSQGLHVCIGKRYSVQIMKILVIKTLLNFEVALQKPDEELELISEMVLKSRTGIHLEFKDRHRGT